MQRTNHRRESSTGSFSSMNFCDYQNYFCSLDNFMNITKSMEDEVMVPSKLRDKNPGILLFFFLSPLIPLKFPENAAFLTEAILQKF